MSIELILACWAAAEERGKAPETVYAVLRGSEVAYWSLSRRQAVEKLAEIEGGRLAKIAAA